MSRGQSEWKITTPNSIQCYCGNSLISGSDPVLELECKHPCGGNRDETCGGDSRLNLYESNSSPTTPTSSSSTFASPSPTSVVTYSDEGCYTEAGDQRALTGRAYYDDLMTLQKCADACIAYTWFGVEYGREVGCLLSTLRAAPG